MRERDQIETSGPRNEFSITLHSVPRRGFLGPHADLLSISVRGQFAGVRDAEVARDGRGLHKSIESTHRAALSCKYLGLTLSLDSLAASGEGVVPCQSLNKAMGHAIAAGVVDDPISQLFQEAAGELTRALARRSGSVELAEEVLSEAFAAACQRSALDDQFSVTPGWLYRVAERRLIDSWRRRTRFEKQLCLLGSMPAVDVEALVGHRDAIERTLGQIPERQGSALKLKYLRQATTASVADQMGLSYSATESLLARARAAFIAAHDAPAALGEDSMS